MHLNTDLENALHYYNYYYYYYRHLHQLLLLAQFLRQPPRLTFSISQRQGLKLFTFRHQAPAGL